MMSPKTGKQSGEEEGRSTGAEFIAGNDDLLTQILLRLPVRTLIRFKIVSKHWLSLISNPQFCVLKSKRCCKHVSGLLVNPRDSEEDSPKFEFIPLGNDCPAPLQRLDFVGPAWTKFDVLQFRNGLLLWYSKSETRCYVINVSTKQHTAVSFPPKKSLDKCYRVGLAFDPRKSPFFKLVCLLRIRSDYYDSEFGAEIYSSETGLTTRFSDVFCTRNSFLSSDSVYWNGAINWIDIHQSAGLYCNVDEERFGILPMPPEAPHHEYGFTQRKICYYGESNDHLYLAQSDTRYYELQFDVYEMDREYKGWFVRFHIDLRPMLESFPIRSSHKDFGILAINVEKDEDGDSFIVLSIRGKAIRLNLKDMVFTKICDFSDVDDAGQLPLFYWFESIQFIESLHPLPLQLTGGVLE